MSHRRRVKHSQTLEQRLAVLAQETRAKAEQLKPGAERDALLKKARVAETAAHLSDWVNSPGVQPPK
jgi:hypothetical protein